MIDGINQPCNELANQYSMILFGDEFCFCRVKGNTPRARDFPFDAFSMARVKRTKRVSHDLVRARVDDAVLHYAPARALGIEVKAVLKMHHADIEITALDKEIAGRPP